MTPNTSATRLTELAGSEWDQNLLAHFQEHVEGESELLAAYAKFRDEGPEYVRYLVELILADEARHHQTFQELVNRLRSDIDWRDYGPQVPYVESAREQAASLTAATDQLMTFELDDAKALQRLQKELRPVRDTTLFSLLVTLMELDTKKHVAILEFIRRKAREKV
jgi:rubrerythrin